MTLTFDLERYFVLYQYFLCQLGYLLVLFTFSYQLADVCVAQQSRNLPG